MCINNKKCEQRRSFLNKIWMLLSSLAILQFGWFGVNIFSQNSRTTKEYASSDSVILGVIEDFEENSVTPIHHAGLYLVRLGENKFLALSPECSHLGCATIWSETQRAFVCPCHGSTFDNRGVPITSPATRPLDYFPVLIKGNEVIVKLGTKKRRSRYDVSQTTVM